MFKRNFTQSLNGHIDIQHIFRIADGMLMFVLLLSKEHFMNIL